VTAKPKKPPTTEKKQEKTKLPAAVTLGHLGGVEGGPARAQALSQQQRTKIAREAALARWRGRYRKYLSKD
jgi:hypothetical protein